MVSPLTRLHTDGTLRGGPTISDDVLTRSAPETVAGPIFREPACVPHMAEPPTFVTLYRTRFKEPNPGGRPTHTNSSRISYLNGRSQWTLDPYGIEATVHPPNNSGPDLRRVTITRDGYDISDLLRVNCVVDIPALQLTHSCGPRDSCFLLSFSFLAKASAFATFSGPSISIIRPPFTPLRILESSIPILSRGPIFSLAFLRASAQSCVCARN